MDDTFCFDFIKRVFLKLIDIFNELNRSC